MTRQKKIILVLSLVVIIAGVLYVFISSRNKYDPTETQTNTASQTGIDITNAADFSTWFDTSHISGVEAAIYARVKQYQPSPASSYKATIRQDSLHTTYSPYEGGDGPTQVPTVAFLVDIPGASESYKVTFSGGDGYPYSILHVLCPDTSQLVYRDFGCKDVEQ